MTRAIHKTIVRTSRAAISLLAFALPAAAVGVSACMSFEQAAPNEIVLITGDASTDRQEGGSWEGCRACLAGACATPLAKCDETPKCTDFFECGADQGCYAPGANLTACLPICGDKVGITSPSDPVIGPWFALESCAHEHCVTECTLGP
jgi:hypothetical protein